MTSGEPRRLPTPPVWADFLRKDWDGRIRLDAPGSHRDIMRWDITLSDGMAILMYDEDADDEGLIDDLIVIGSLEFDPEEDRWVAVVDPVDFKHVSELPSRDAAEYRRYRPQSQGRVRLA